MTKHAILLDYGERILGFILYGHLFVRIVVANAQPISAADGILLASEGMVLFFLLIRRRSRRTTGDPLDWFVAFTGTLAPLAVWPTTGGGIVPAAICGMIALMGFLLHVAAKLTLRRSFGIVPANRGVKLGGPYRWVRHPMYAGYMATYAGFLLANPGMWNLFVYVIAVGAQLVRIHREEALLRDDDAYRRLMEQTPYRIVPLIY
ncbi:MAG: isoprenylcysteine carboxylmethyltransferase family protein [Phyllobacteriaceae bacterium]|nr:isoprenylcysteine carboxylmethyltransferase family protein [Phyllobacteriaceae bacterium]